jgi:tetratricopeptide (TPR) repeat protein
MNLRKLIFAIIAPLSISLNLSAQNVEDAFAKSYTAEANGKYAEAATPLKAVYNAKSYELNLRLGYVTYMASSLIESKNYYQKAVELMPYSIEAKLGYALPLAALNEWSTVASQYKDILKIDPQNSTANYRLGSIYYYNKDYASAYKHLEKVVNLYPFSYDGLILFAWTNYQMGKMNEARAFFKRVLLLSPKDKSALEGLSLVK